MESPPEKQQVRVTILSRPYTLLATGDPREVEELLFGERSSVVLDPGLARTASHMIGWSSGFTFWMMGGSIWEGKFFWAWAMWLLPTPTGP